MRKSLVVYGSYGYTGKLIVDICRSKKLEVVLAGRNEQWLKLQSETTVREIVDFFLLLMLAGAGDELQGIKKGIIEMADTIVITKADNENISHAERAKNEYQHALHLFELPQSGWIPKVVTSSALVNTGVAEVWDMIEKYQEKTLANGYLKWKREEQNVGWFHSQTKEFIESQILRSITSIESVKLLEKQIKEKVISPVRAAQEIMSKLKKHLNLS